MTGTRWLLTCTLALGLTSSSGCVDERAFFFSGNFSECVPTTTTTQSLVRGVWDISGRQPYLLYPTLRSDLPSSTINDNEQPERNRLTLRKLSVTLDLGRLAQPNIDTEYEVLLTGIIDPGGELKLANVPIIPGAVSQLLNVASGANELIIAKVQAKADTPGGSVDSVEFEFPIEVCNGCLVTSIGECSTLADRSEAELSRLAGLANSCGAAQDASSVCCTQQGQQVCLKPAQITP